MNTILDPWAILGGVAIAILLTPLIEPVVFAVAWRITHARRRRRDDRTVTTLTFPQDWTLKDRVKPPREDWPNGWTKA